METTAGSCPGVLRRLSVLVLGMCVVGLAALALAGCSRDEPVFVEQEYTIDGAGIDGITIDVRDRQIDVAPSEDDLIHIAYFKSELESYDIAVEEGRELHMVGTQHKEWTDYIGSKPAVAYRTIALRIPGAQVGALTLTTTNASVTVAPLVARQGVSLASNGGSIAFEGLEVGKFLDLTVKNGSIAGTVVGGYDDFSIQTNVKKGTCNLPSRKDDGEKTLRVDCNNGDAEIALVAE